MTSSSTIDKIVNYSPRESSDKDKSNKNKKINRYLFYKYSKNISLAEAILVDDHPFFLQIQNGKPILSESIQINDQLLIVPPDKSSYLSEEYVFSSKEEVEQYKSRAENETLGSLFKKAKNIWKKYFDIDNETLTLCSADTIFTYFQDKLGMTHYLLFVGDNSSGKSNALRIFHHLGYRPLFDVSITTANIYNFLGQFEEGQGIILEDELDNIENQEDKMRIYKTGYVSGAQVTRMYESSNKGKAQQRYNTFCFKAFSSEQQPRYKGRGFAERIFTIKCSPGSPQYDISEVVNDAGDLEHKKLYREIEDLRKLLLVYRMIHYNDNFPDIHLSIKNRDKQLCKPLLRLFSNTKAQKEIMITLSKFLTEKKNTKLNSLDSYLFSAISELVKEENTIVISNYDIWKIVCYLPGNDVKYKPHCYQTDDFGIVSKTMVTKICEDKFGAIKSHSGEGRSLVFNKNTLQKLKNNYSQTNEIKVFSNKSLPNTFNTFGVTLEKIHIA
jgi:hypothetical protein